MSYSNDDRWWKGISAYQKRPPWLPVGDLCGTEHIRREDVEFPDARGIDPEAKLVRRELERVFRKRRDGQLLYVTAATFQKVRFAIKQRAFPQRHEISQSERIAAVQLVAHEHIGLDLSAASVAHRLSQGDTPPAIARWLLAQGKGVSARRLRIARTT